ncbi:pyrroline-5-carboxylate reductase [Mucor circinelloides 1006PhL]|uniref:Pyrroline-5-carboxylate reductase n=1 Tax=Mucor circinelloides f. circinelloides (strain 1006PhL) TaxID=1220926 RepID=S2IXA5_MUCC1|nr:pyrroline-5-carboxylate reductase [Mucor circinelloides 1006PhL]
MVSTTDNAPVIAFIGAGNMAEAVLGGLYSNGHPKSHLRFSELLDERRNYMSERYPGVFNSASNDQVVEGADIVIFAVKPQVLRPVVTGLAPALHKNPSALLISIAAGIETSAILSWLDAKDYEAPLIRIMPNTPALIGEGATGLFATSVVTQQQKELTERLLGSVSKVLSWVDSESLIDTVTGVSGSGPAYFFLMMEAIENAGVDAGLSREDAKALTLQTCLGAARMAQNSEDDLTTLRKKVTSPNGTTEAAIKTMQGAKIEEILRDAVFAATDRSKELAAQLGRDQ